MSDEKTPGQVFRETLHGRWSARGQRIDTRPYDELPQVDRDDLEAATLAAIGDWAKTLAEVTEERDRLGELLEEVGVMAANAPEDGDSFGLLEEIAMRIAAHGVPLDEDEQRAADLRAHASGMGGPSPAWVTDDAAGLGSVDIGSPEDGDHDDCEPTL